MSAVFVSYSHRDESWKDRLVTQLEAAGIEVWQDRRIRTGDKWREEITEAMERARVAVLLVSADFLTSQFIATSELPRLLERRRAEGMIVAPVIVRPCAWQVVQWLKDIQAHANGRALAAVPKAKAEQQMADLTMEIVESQATPPAPEGDRSATGQPARGYSVDEALTELGAPPLVVSRVEPLEAVRRWSEQKSSPLLLIQGLPGIGKSVLVRDFLDDGSGGWERVLPVGLSGPAAGEPAYLVETFNDFLRGEGRAIPDEHLRSHPPERNLRTLLDRLIDLDVLVLLDGLDRLTADWQSALLKPLSAASAARTIVTTRMRPAGGSFGQVLQLAPLSSEESEAFCLAYGRVFDVESPGSELLEALPEGIRSHPQALMAALSRLADFPSALLAAEGLSPELREPAGAIVRAVEGLDPESRRLLGLLGVVDGQDLPQSFQELDLASPDRLIERLQSLIEASLVQRAEASYRVPAAVLDALETTDEAALLEGVHALGVWARGFADSVDISDGRAALLTRGAQVAAERGHWPLVLELVGEPILDQLNLRGRWKEYSALLRFGLEAAQAGEDRSRWVGLACRLARKLDQMGDSAGAEATLAEIEALPESDRDSLERAELSSHRGLRLTRSGKVDEALSELEESRRIREALGDEAGLGIVEKLIGNALLRKGELDRAAEAYERSLAHFERAPVERHRLDVEASLALCDLRRERSQPAEDRLRRTLATCEELGYEVGAARAELNLALVYDSLGRSSEALELADRAAARAESNDRAIVAAAAMVASRLRRLEES